MHQIDGIGPKLQPHGDGRRQQSLLGAGLESGANTPHQGREQAGNWSWGSREAREAAPHSNRTKAPSPWNVHHRPLGLHLQTTDSKVKLEFLDASTAHYSQAQARSEVAGPGNQPHAAFPGRPLSTGIPRGSEKEKGQKLRNSILNANGHI